MQMELSGWAARNTVTLLLLLILFSSVSSAQNTDSVLNLTPSSLLVPLHFQANFVCETTCLRSQCFVYWYEYSTTSGSRLLNSDVPEDITINYNEMMVNATARFNTTVKFSCDVSQKGHNNIINQSNIATLQAVAERPMKQNTMIEFLNNTMKLKWLPPYLWIGQHVDTFTILIKSKNDEGSEVLNEININSTFRALETYQDSLTHHRKCTEFSFEIRAYDNIIGMLPKRVNVSGRYPEESSPGEFGAEALHATVLFEKNTTPSIVKIFVKLPQVCRYQDIKYTFIIDHSNGSNVMFSGPYNHTGSGNISHEISVGSDLERDMEYSIRVLVNTSHGANKTSESILISTYLCNGEVTRQTAYRLWTLVLCSFLMHALW